MNHSAEIATIKKRLSELETSDREVATTPATIGQRYSNAQDLVRNAAELPPALERDHVGMVRIGGRLASPDEIEAAFAARPELTPKPQQPAVTPPIGDTEMTATEKRLAAHRAKNEAADAAFQRWSQAGLPKGWFRDMGGVVRMADGSIAPISRAEASHE